MLGPPPRTLVRIFTYFLRIFLEEKGRRTKFSQARHHLVSENSRASRGTSLTLNRFLEIIWSRLGKVQDFTEYDRNYCKVTRRGGGKKPIHGCFLLETKDLKFCRVA